MRLKAVGCELVGSALAAVAVHGGQAGHALSAQSKQSLEWQVPTGTRRCFLPSEPRVCVDGSCTDPPAASWARAGWSAEQCDDLRKVVKAASSNVPAHLTQSAAAAGIRGIPPRCSKLAFT